MKTLTVRARDLVGRAGVGAIVEIGRQSFATTDLAFWGRGEYRGAVINLPRLASRLGVTELRTASGVADRGPAFVRFPAWLFCERCGRMEHYPPSRPVDSQPECRACGGSLIGMRWVVACSSGHLTDVPWHAWAHLDHLRRIAHEPRCESWTGLQLRTLTGNRATYESTVISCTDCGRASSLKGLVGRRTLVEAGWGSCPGLHPWSGNDAASCEAETHVLLRASSRLHFPRTVSTLEIPPDADRPPDTELGLRISQSVGGFTWKLWLSQRQAGTPIADLAYFAGELDCTVDQIEALLDAEIDPGGHVVGAGSLLHAEDAEAEQAGLVDEWAAFVTPRPTQPEWSRFVTEHIDTSALRADTHGLVGQVVLAHRLKEVRAYGGYRRITSDPNGSAFVFPTRARRDGSLASSWLPAHAVMGEGVFIDIQPAALADWARTRSAASGASDQALADRLAGSHLAVGPSAGTMTHQWFLPLHTLAHLLIREMAYSAGYSAASLRERIFLGTAPDGRVACAILVYTADGDSEGTLGGLVRLGRPARLSEMLRTRSRRSIWCSQDPVCRESEGQGMLGLNLAACHGCCLVPETSCAYQNVVLDRNAVVSTDPRRPGVLESLVD